MMTVPGAVAVKQDGEYQRDFDKGGHDGKQADAEQEGNAVGAAVDVGQEAADLAPGVESGA